MRRDTLLARPESRSALAAWLETHGTLAAAAAADSAEERLEGRGRVHAVPAPSGPWPAGTRWVVRHYRRGGAVARAMGDRYARMGEPRPVREYRALRTLERHGIPAVRVVGAAVYREGLFYRGDLVTEWVPGSSDLARILFGPGHAGGAASPVQPRRALQAAGSLVRLLHEGGVVHPDLNIKNILIAPDRAPDEAEGGAWEGSPRALAVDLDRARIRPRPLSHLARRRMLRRFERSLRKWAGRAGDAPVGEWLAAFHRGYDEAR